MHARGADAKGVGDHPKIFRGVANLLSDADAMLIGMLERV
jgi:hypothetical protein